MNPRRFVIPTVSILGLSLTAGCADPLVGEWDVTSATPRGQEAKSVPYDYQVKDFSSYYYGDTITESFHMTVGRGLGGSFVSTYQFYRIVHHTWSVAAQDLGQGKYDIALDDSSYPMDFQCTLGGTLLDCDDSNTNDFWANLKFQKQ